MSGYLTNRKEVTTIEFSRIILPAIISVTPYMVLSVCIVAYGYLLDVGKDTNNLTLLTLPALALVLYSTIHMYRNIKYEKSGKRGGK